MDALCNSGGLSRCQAGRWQRVLAFVIALMISGWIGRAAVAQSLVPRINGLPTEAANAVGKFESEANALRIQAELAITAKRRELELSLKNLQDQ